MRTFLNMSKLGLTFKMTVLVVAGAILVFAVLLGETYLSSLGNNTGTGPAECQEHGQGHGVQELNRNSGLWPRFPKISVSAWRTASLTRQQLLDLLRRTVAENKEVFGSTAAYEPHAFDERLMAFAPYFYKSADGVKYSNLAQADYNYFKWDWYREPCSTGQPVWSEPYFDEGGGGILMCTYSVPMFSAPEKRVGGSGA